MAIRETFIQKVKGLIVENHGVSDGSFILGISARWGEGKTKFLDDLEIELGDEFLIVKLSPWKFGLDKTSFLRHFLTELNKKANRKVKLDRLYYDISENKPSFGWYMPLFFIILLILLLAVSFPTFFWLADTYNIISKFILDISKSKFVVNILYFKWVLTLLLIPFLLKIFTFQRSSNAITTLTDFDKFLEEILHNIKKKKIVVYVDDLDRVTPKIARDVLDDLRTFFDQKKITFIITGDHSVLEQYIGQEILPNNSPGEKTEEGRRYLKKIFNIYWRLLPPSNSDFSKFVDDEVEKRKDKLLEIFKETQVDIFKGYLSKYFEKNYRQVIRFIDYLIFYFDAIQSQINISDGDEKEFLSDLTNHPLLVVRILLLQDICNPLYEAVLKEPALLFSIEEYTDKQKMDLVDNQIKQRNIIMSPDQNMLTKQWLQETERFFVKSSLVVNNLEPFLYISIDQDCSDLRGASAEDFVGFVKNQEIDLAVNALINGGKTRIEENAKSSISALSQFDNIDTQQKYLEDITQIMASISVDHESHFIFANEMKDIDLEPWNNLDVDNENKINLYKNIWSWLDKIASKDWFGNLTLSYKNKFPFKHVEDFEKVGTTSTGPFSTEVLGGWFLDYYSQNQLDCINKIFAIASSLDKDILISKIETISDGLVQNLIANVNSPESLNVLAVINDYTISGSEKLKLKLEEQALARNPDISTWALNTADTIEENVWTREFIEQAIINSIPKSPSETDLSDLIKFASDKIIKLNESFWDKIFQHKDIFLILLPTIVNEDYYSIAPPTRIAGILFGDLLQKIFSSHDLDEKISLLAMLEKGHWIWGNLPNINRNLLPKKQELKDSVDKIKESWQ